MRTIRNIQRREDLPVNTECWTPPPRHVEFREHNRLPWVVVCRSEWWADSRRVQSSEVTDNLWGDLEPGQIWEDSCLAQGLWGSQWHSSHHRGDVYHRPLPSHSETSSGNNNNNTMNSEPVNSAQWWLYLFLVDIINRQIEQIPNHYW